MRVRITQPRPTTAVNQESTEIAPLVFVSERLCLVHLSREALQHFRAAPKTGMLDQLPNPPSVAAESLNLLNPCPCAAWAPPTTDAALNVAPWAARAVDGTCVVLNEAAPARPPSDLTTLRIMVVCCPNLPRSTSRQTEKWGGIYRMSFSSRGSTQS